MSKRTQEELFYAWVAEVRVLAQLQTILQKAYDLLIQSGATKEQILEMKKQWQNEFYETMATLNLLAEEINEFVDAKVAAGFPKKGKK